MLERNFIGTQCKAYKSLPETEYYEDVTNYVLILQPSARIMDEKINILMYKLYYFKLT